MKDKDLIVIGERIKGIRQDKKMDRNQLAQKIGVSQRTVIAYEQGTRNIPSTTLKKICQCLNISADFILGNMNYEKSITDLQAHQYDQMPLPKSIRESKEKYYAVKQFTDFIDSQKNK